MLEINKRRKCVPPPGLEGQREEEAFKSPRIRPPGRSWTHGRPIVSVGGATRNWEKGRNMLISLSPPPTPASLSPPPPQFPAPPPIGWTYREASWQGCLGNVVCKDQLPVGTGKWKWGPKTNGYVIAYANALAPGADQLLLDHKAGSPFNQGPLCRR